MQDYSVSPLMQLFNQGVQTSGLENTYKQDYQKEFQQVLSAMMFSQSFSPFSGSDTSQSVWANDMLSPLMFMLMNSMSAETANENGDIFSNALSNTYYTNSNVSSLSQAQMLQINQFDAELSVGGDGANANCGPTALSMALHGIGYAVSGETPSSSDGEIVDLARRSMIKDSYRDGVDENGNRAEYEHNSYTNFTDLMNGVKAAGAQGRIIEPNSESVRTALLRNSKVVVSGTFAGKSPLPWTGDRGNDNQIAPGGATAHFVTVTGYDAQRDLFIVNDPARRTPLVVTGNTLEAFMRGNAGALEVYR